MGVSSSKFNRNQPLTTPRYLPPEVQREILARLRVKSLMRFRCVCREWYAIISNSDFISQHLAHSLSCTNKPKLLKHKCRSLKNGEYISEERYAVYKNDKFIKKGTRVLDFPIERFRHFPEFVGGTVLNLPTGWRADFPKFVGSCHGLIAMYDSKPGYAHVLIIWNPSINRYIISQNPEVKPVTVEAGVSRVGFGFGFVSQTKDYKFVSVYYLSEYEGRRYGEVLPRVKLFSFLSGEWRTLEYTVRRQSESRINPNYDSQVVFDGVVHWSGERKVQKSGGRIVTCYVIVKFNLSNEKFGEIVLPKTIVDATPGNKVLPVMLRGLFSVVYYNKAINPNDNSSHCTIWAMTDYGDADSWTQLYKININEKIGRVVGMRRNGEILLSVRGRDLFLSEFGTPLSRGELVSYNSENGKYRRTSIFGKKSSFVVDDYVESLVLLGKGDEVSEKHPNQHQIDVYDYCMDPDPVHNSIQLFFLIATFGGVVLLLVGFIVELIS